MIKQAWRVNRYFPFQAISIQNIIKLVTFLLFLSQWELKKDLHSFKIVPITFNQSFLLNKFSIQFIFLLPA